MELNICHLYPDVLNLYGDRGNIACMKKRLEWRGMEAEVREFLLETQKDIAREYNVIMDGRDIGTVVLPDADLKIYLTASAEERASRRYLEMEDKPDKPTYDQILEDIKQRDYNDMHRAVSPLRQADDAVLIDSTTMGFHEVCEEIMDLIEQRLDVE